MSGGSMGRGAGGVAASEWGEAGGAVLAVAATGTPAYLLFDATPEPGP
ncbi:hypothetical protein [Gaopeijia maritima]